jgi:hypothetical protein
LEVRDRVAFLIARGRAAGISRWAVVSAGEAHYGMARMAEILGDLERGPKPELCIFKDLAEAVAWASGQIKRNHGVA